MAKKENLETVLCKDFLFLTKISQSLQPPVKEIKKSKSKLKKREEEMKETAVARSTANQMLFFLKSRDNFWRNLGK